MILTRNIALLLLALLALPLASALAAENTYSEGEAYHVIVPQAPKLTDSDKVEVIEIFWYGCPHCHRFQPYLERWSEDNADDIHYVRLPAILDKGWAIHARAYYTAEALGVLDRVHQPLFDAIHKHKRPLNNEESLMAFFEEHGIDNKTFRKAFYSFSVSGKVGQAEELTRRYQVSGTPAVIVDGQYYTSPKQAQGSFEEMLKIMDFLIDKAKGETHS